VITTVDDKLKQIVGENNIDASPKVYRTGKQLTSGSIAVIL